MQSMKKIFTIIIVLLISAVSTTWSQEQKLAEILLKAEAANKLIPILSTQTTNMDVNKAYRIQKAYVETRLKTDTLAGFKAGLTSKGAQQRFGVNSPAAGALFESGKLTGKSIIDSSKFHRLMLETEIGFVVGVVLTKPVSDIAALKKSIKAVMPVIELPDLGFTDMKLITGPDIIAANVSSRKFIVGKSQPPGNIDLNAVSVTLSLNENQINQGKGSDASGDQWAAALWLVNTMIKKGWTLEPGQNLITGALGRMLPGKPGKYVADYRSFGKIEFEIK